MNQDPILKRLELAYNEYGRTWNPELESLLKREWIEQAPRSQRDQIVAAIAVFGRLACQMALKKSTFDESNDQLHVGQTLPFRERYGVLDPPNLDFARMHWSLTRLADQYAKIVPKTNLHAVVGEVHRQMTVILFPPFDRESEHDEDRFDVAEEYLKTNAPELDFRSYWSASLLTDAECRIGALQKHIIFGWHPSEVPCRCAVCRACVPLYVMVWLNAGSPNRSICPSCARQRIPAPRRRWFDFLRS